jgi:hypothetical protein
MVGNCSGNTHIQPRQIFDLTDLLEKIWLFGRFEEYRFENRYYSYISRCTKDVFSFTNSYVGLI